MWANHLVGFFLLNQAHIVRVTESRIAWLGEDAVKIVAKALHIGRALGMSFAHLFVLSRS
jgi:hypothetical protein